MTNPHFLVGIGTAIVLVNVCFVLCIERKPTNEEYDSFLMYSRVVRIDSVHISDEHNLNAPYPSIQSKELMRNAIGLTYDYERSTLFYSDIQLGSINAVHFNGSNHRQIVERLGSVEGLAYEAIDNMLYWTCNNDATINKVNLSENWNSLKPETIIKLGPSDKPRGIAVDSCDRRMYWTNWNSHHPCIQRAFLTGFGQQSIITTDIRIPNALTLDHSAKKLYWGDAKLDKIERCEYDGTNRVVLARVTPKHPFDMAVYGDLLFWTDWVQQAVIRANKLTGADVVWLRKDVARPMGIVAISNNSMDLEGGGAIDPGRAPAGSSQVAPHETLSATDLLERAHKAIYAESESSSDQDNLDTNVVVTGDLTDNDYFFSLPKEVRCRFNLERQRLRREKKKAEGKWLSSSEYRKLRPKRKRSEGTPSLAGEGEFQGVSPMRRISGSEHRDGAPAKRPRLWDVRPVRSTDQDAPAGGSGTGGPTFREQLTSSKVAVPSEFPDIRLNEDECRLLQRKLMAFVRSKDSAVGPLQIHKTFLEQGALVVVCGNDDTNAWLKQVFNGLEYRDGAKVVAGDYKDLLRSVKVLLRTDKFTVDLSPREVLDLCTDI